MLGFIDLSLVTQAALLWTLAGILAAGLILYFVTH